MAYNLFMLIEQTHSPKERGIETERERVHFTQNVQIITPSPLMINAMLHPLSSD